MASSQNILIRATSASSLTKKHRVESIPTYPSVPASNKTPNAACGNICNKPRWTLECWWHYWNRNKLRQRHEQTSIRNRDNHRRFRYLRLLSWLPRNPLNTEWVNLGHRGSDSVGHVLVAVFLLPTVKNKLSNSNSPLPESGSASVPKLSADRPHLTHSISEF
jgi:hypothetical protein